jgi:hypothetical protein
MSRRFYWIFAICAGLALIAPATRADDQADHLRDLAKQAHTQGDLDQEADDLCRAASIDHQKYQKRCDHARGEVAKQLKAFEGNLGTGKFEIQQKDYQGAIRDLSKIRFGPLKNQAESLIAAAKAALAQPAVDAASGAALRAALTAYQQGDFDAATAQANQVQSPTLQPQAQQILTNIRVYQDTIAQADNLMKNGEYQGAEQKYSFAINIKNDGPGNPAQKLQQAQAMLQQQSAGQQTAADQAGQPSLPKVDYAAKIRALLAAAASDESKGDLRGALQHFNNALALDGLQPDAIAGKKRVTAELRKDQTALTASLADGIRSYYNSDFTHATEEFNLYLSGSGTRDQGLAHFYLAAALLSQAILADPHDAAQAQDLRQNAQQQFALARQAHYKPIDKLVSPKILAAWTDTGNQP